MKLLKNKIILITCLLTSFTFNSFSQSGWQIQYDNGTEEYYDIYFINEYTGWTIETWNTGKILKTTNKGLNWISISTLQFVDGTGISFYDEFTGWISASSGQLYRTTDGGQNWVHSDCGNCSTIDDFIDIQFINQFTGWVYGDEHVYKSTNSGLNYFRLNCNVDVYNGFFLDSLNGWVGGFEGINCTGKSMDGGNSWFQYSYVNSSVQGIHFVNLNTGWICTFEGLIFKTTNSGINWIEQNGNNSKRLYKIQFVSVNTGWVVGDSGTVLKTTNGGSNWYSQITPTSSGIRGIFMVSPNEGWVCGERYILHTIDGGGPIGIQPISSEIPNLFSLSQNFPNPFNPSTKIKFDIPPSREARGMIVRLIIYDALGREITSLVNEQLKPGSYEVEFDGSNYPSGVYFYKMLAGDYAETKKMVLIK